MKKKAKDRYKNLVVWIIGAHVETTKLGSYYK